VRATFEEVGRSAAGLIAMADDVVAVDQREPRPREARLEVAVRDSIRHIEHMARWIGGQNAGYSFEGLGEDMPGIRAALAPPQIPSLPETDPLRATRAALFMCAASCQGRHSDAGAAAAAEILGIDFPLRRDALWARAVSEGFKPEELWPWLAKVRRDRLAEERRQRDVCFPLDGASAGNETKDVDGEGK
ncbi:hypothetical protein, partial [Parvibaculum sp.]